MALEKQPLFQHIVVRCICTLLDANPHFNFRESLLDATVRNISSTNEAIRSSCNYAVGHSSLYPPAQFFLFFFYGISLERAWNEFYKSHLNFRLKISHQKWELCCHLGHKGKVQRNWVLGSLKCWPVLCCSSPNKSCPWFSDHFIL